MNHQTLTDICLGVLIGVSTLLVTKSVYDSFPVTHDTINKSIFEFGLNKSYFEFAIQPSNYSNNDNDINTTHDIVYDFIVDKNIESMCHPLVSEIVDSRCITCITDFATTPVNLSIQHYLRMDWVSKKEVST